MSAPTDQIAADAAKIHTDASLLHQITHGSNTTTVTTEGGNVKSAAKVIKDMDDALQQAADELEAEFAINPVFNGTVNGTPTGGTLNLSNTTLTLPSYFQRTAQGFAALNASFQYWDHRGNLNVFPEHTLESYRASVAAGAKVVEIDVQKLADGSLVVMHDDTLDRTTSASGNTADQTALSWAALAVDVGNYRGAAWSNLKPPLFKDVIREFGNLVPLIIEVKSAGDGTGAAILTELQRARISKDMVLINSFSASELTQFIADGWSTALNLGTYAGSPTPATLLATGYQWISCASTTTTAQLDALRAAGLKANVYTLDLHRQIYPFLGHVDSIYTNDGAYIRGSARRNTDPFASQQFYHGHVAVNADGENTGRGYFVAPNYWGYDLDAANTWAGALQGWASPMNGQHTEDGTTKLNSVVINFTVKFVDDFSATRFAWVGITTNDIDFASDVSGHTKNGYTFTATKSGAISIFRYTTATLELAYSIATASGTSIADGAEATYRITVTPTDLTFERIDVPTTCTVADTTHRGAYLHAGVKGIHGLFKSIAITYP